jgi:hypothetical protein
VSLSGSLSTAQNKREALGATWSIFIGVVGMQYIYGEGEKLDVKVLLSFFISYTPSVRSLCFKMIL